MATDFNVKVAQCPGCGAQLEFKVGSSRLVVCGHCSFVVARGDRGLESLGKVADLVPTGAKITLGITGRLKGAAFSVVGRTQLKWAQGVWDEWYVAFENGRWGWLAEAQGRYYLSFRVADRPTPAWSALRPGKSVPLGELGKFTASDLKRASYVGAAGELPEKIPLDGVNIRTADLSGDKGAFATLDYGAEGEEADVYVGREVAFDELGLDASRLAAPAKLDRIKGLKLTCPKCNGPIELKVPDQAMRVACPFCGALLDCTQGNLQQLAVLKMRSTAIPMGAKGTLQGVEYLVLGWLERRCTVEGVDYFWEEYLLYDERTANFRFLVCSDNHWSFVDPVPAGEVDDLFAGPGWRGKVYRRFSSAEADVTGVRGEFYWAVALGERVTASDSIAPPESLSEERGADEVNWSHAVYLEPAAVRDAFKLAKPLTAPTSIGMMQPNPWGARLASMRWPLLLGVAGALALFIFLATRPSVVVFEETLVPSIALRPAGASASAPQEGADLVPGTDSAIDPMKPESGVVRLSAPFQIPEGHRNLQVEVSASVDNSWAEIGGALVSQATNEVTEFGIESSYYHGVASGVDEGTPWTEAWSEGSPGDTTYLSAVDSGEYVLRTETAWEPGKPQPTVRVKITSGVARWTHLFLLLGALLAIPLLGYWRSAAFEKGRWEQSDFSTTPSSGGSSSDDDD